MLDLMQIYPELRGAIDNACQGAAWCVTGSSALLRDPQGAFIFELTKPKHWVTRAGGQTVVGLGGLGGTLEYDEPILDGLYREMDEELGAAITIGSAETTYLVYEEHSVTPIALPQRELPCPVLFTISRNLNRQQQLSEFPILAIATFMATLQDDPQLDDLYGLLTVPPEQLTALLGPAEISLPQALALPGVQVSTREPWEQRVAPERVVLRPVWTGRSLQVLLHQGCLGSL